MKIPLSESDFLLLLRRYMKDGYLVNYVAFLKHIDNIIAYLGEHHLLDNSHVSANFNAKEFARMMKCVPNVGYYQGLSGTFSGPRTFPTASY